MTNRPERVPEADRRSAGLLQLLGAEVGIGQGRVDLAGVGVELVEPGDDPADEVVRSTSARSPGTPCRSRSMSPTAAATAAGSPRWPSAASSPPRIFSAGGTGRDDGRRDPDDAAHGRPRYRGGRHPARQPHPRVGSVGRATDGGGEAVGGRPGGVLGRRLDHYPDERLRAAGAHEHRTAVAELGLDRRGSPRRKRAAGSAMRSAADVDEDLGSRVIAAARSASGLPERHRRRPAPSRSTRRPPSWRSRGRSRDRSALRRASGRRRRATRARSDRRPRSR